MATHKRTEEATPSGGAYSEIWYFNDKGENVDETVATRCIIRECDRDGRLLKEIHGMCGKQKRQDAMYI